jgi:sulfite exporter TauE/SafE
MEMVWLALVGGAAAFAHCLGMCGVFALHLSGGQGGWAVLGRQFLWHAGKTTTYMFLGALAATAGLAIGSAWPRVQEVLAYCAGGAMILLGLALLGALPRVSLGRAPSGGGLLSGAMSRMLGNPSAASALALGVMTGFLPCPIVVAFLLAAAHSKSVAMGIAIMGAMGVGTVWSLLALGMTGRLLQVRLRRWAPVVGGVTVLLLGAATLLRGTEAFHHVLGCPAKAASVDEPGPSSAPSSAPSCCGKAH